LRKADIESSRKSLYSPIAVPSTFAITFHKEKQRMTGVKHEHYVCNVRNCGNFLQKKEAGKAR